MSDMTVIGLLCRQSFLPNISQLKFARNRIFLMTPFDLQPFVNYEWSSSP